jgi:opacity protein-like surface antigen
MKARLLIGAATVCAFVAATPAFTPAFADEQPPPPPSDYPAPSAGAPWSGWYVGGHLGGAGDTSDLSFQDFSAQQNLSFRGDDSGGFLGGVHGGYGWMNDNLYLGVEGDTSWARHTDYLSSIRARAGFGSDRFLVYGTAGVGFIGTKQHFVVDSADDGPSGFSRSFDDTGFVGGGGVEYALARNLSLGVEGLWYDFGTDRSNLTTPVGDDFTVRNKGDFGVARARLTWYLNN